MQSSFQLFDIFVHVKGGVELYRIYCDTIDSTTVYRIPPPNEFRAFDVNVSLKARKFERRDHEHGKNSHKCVRNEIATQLVLLNVCCGSHE